MLLPTLLALAVVGAAISLGQWQLRRADEKRAMQAQVDELRGQYAQLERQYATAAPTTRVRVLTDSELGRSSE